MLRRPSTISPRSGMRCTVRAYMPSSPPMSRYVAARIDFIRSVTACSVAFGTSLPSTRSQPNCLLPPL